ncbi:cyanophycinase [Mucilaginibacter sp. Bleaf8]|uniref:cyanophycinase n=1 Tax=Mucilaginibacter sp. Bleaf8 TaxID=2834430 RepID=UPI001BCF1083|nr:cyanophycinase [Mucilaginibacter sp. Bleaf8]MBS7563803.1 cyanophycinase [Mucilaginibacter sp. Bleaf8]
MKIKLLTLITLITFQAGLVKAQQTASVTGPEKGSLVIVGGGNIGPEIWSRFVELAGGPNAKIIYVPTAGEDSTIAKNDSRTIAKLKDLGVKSIIVLHTRDSKVANTEAFVKPIREATGVWFEGGRQWKIADSFLNTLAHQEFRALLDRGGVIGGTSAGATIQGSYLFRGDTKGNTVLVGNHTQGLDFIHNVAIDQHILKRNRQFDLLGFIKTRPDLLGIGIDESTAIVVHQNQFEVLGASYVAIYDQHQFDGKIKNPSSDSGNNGPFYYLQKGQKFDLQLRQVLNPTKTTASKTGAN